MNVPRPIAIAVSSRLTTMYELSTKLGTEDLHDILEIIAVDGHNRSVANAQKD